jgi:hypothetical protein
MLIAISAASPDSGRPRLARSQSRARLRVIWRSHGRKLDGLLSWLSCCQALMKASCAMSSLACTSRVIARAIAVTVFWQASTMRPYDWVQPEAAAGSSRSRVAVSRGVMAEFPEVIRV